MSPFCFRIVLQGAFIKTEMYNETTLNIKPVMKRRNENGIYKKSKVQYY